MALDGTYDREVLALDPTPVETERLRLRLFEEGDAHAMWLMLSNPNVMRFIPRPAGTDEAEEKQAFLKGLKEGRFKFFYAVTWKSSQHGTDETALGWVLMRPTPDGRFVEVGYWFREEYWGMGLATEAGRAAIEAARKTMGFPDHDLFAYVLRGNEPSRNVLRKLGLEHRQDAVIDGDEVWELYGPGAEIYEETVRFIHKQPETIPVEG
ncbi:GNAT family N-acetyltransferase [Kordiimonas lacus]|uniref:Protein N-acetyltransferase, RimJ/RimL family n=1 Tax=Kordiimonas lacus TaxID=637679 RepID=A0A1G6UC73_9PROT|nr:GNAT family N-acetyltransferase [Kordiimonas lacus]SDD38197.1 Protein N-acetyltransferase, RimJ/RimL family [Kordiimonas lacus]